MYNDEFFYFNSLPLNNSNMMIDGNELSKEQNKYLDYNNSNKPSLYNPYEGLIRGNMFKNLYSPYFKEEPFSLKPSNNQERELYNVMAYGFATTDLNLYLDTHPNDKGIITLFNQYEGEYNRLVNEYEKKYGPITLSSKALNAYPWSWNKSAWPWEGNR